MKKLVSLVLLIFLYGCDILNECELSVAKFDLSKPYSENLDFNFCGNDPVFYQLKFSGTLEGDILVQEFYKFSGTGKFDTLIVSDYYAEEFLFEYRPLGEVSGDLEFRISLR